MIVSSQNPAPTSVLRCIPAVIFRKIAKDTLNATQGQSAQPYRVKKVFYLIEAKVNALMGPK